MHVDRHCYVRFLIMCCFEYAFIIEYDRSHTCVIRDNMFDYPEMNTVDAPVQVIFNIDCLCYCRINDVILGQRFIEWMLKNTQFTLYNKLRTSYAGLWNIHKLQRSYLSGENEWTEAIVKHAIRLIITVSCRLNVFSTALQLIGDQTLFKSCTELGFIVLHIRGATRESGEPIDSLPL